VGGNGRRLFEEWTGILRGNDAARFAAAERTAADREQVRETLRTYESFGHDLLLRTLSEDAGITNIDFLEPMTELAGRIRPRDARRWLAALRRAEEQIDRNANVLLALQAAFLDAPR
jgi:hypothetical protein